MVIVFSTKQKEIITCSTNDDHCNVVVDAVAGSGKTTTICGIVRHNHNKKILILTYNRHLSQETAQRLRSLNLTNGDIYTVHGFIYTYYNSHDYTDRIIIDTINKNIPLKKSPPKYDIIVLDEFQDFNPRMVEAVIKFIRDVSIIFLKWKPRLYLLGDKYQCVYDDLHGSDNRYLIHAPTLFSIFGNWKRLSLQTTYRLTDKIVEFLNKAVLRSDFFISEKKGVRKPHYVICNVFSNILHEWIYEFILENDYAPDDIFILAPSVKNSNSPVFRLTNFLSSNGYPIYCSNQFDGGSVLLEEIANKIAVNTFHVCKGRERRLVIVFNFDNSYFTYFAKNKSDHDCTNPQYVSITRGTTDLIVIQNFKEETLPFIDYDALKETCEVVTLQSPNCEPSKSSNDELLSVTELLEYLSFDVLQYAEQFYKCTISDTKNKILLSSTVAATVNDRELVENVSNLNGNLITLINEYENTGKVSLLENYRTVGDLLAKSKDLQLLWREIKSSSKSIHSKLVNLSLLLEVEGTGTTHRLRQITNKNWLTKDDWKNIVEKFTAEVGKERMIFEHSVTDDDITRGKRLTGRVDVIDDKTKVIYECKWVHKVSDMHKVQTLLYYYLLCKQDDKYVNYTPVLINFKEGKRYTFEIMEQDLFPLVDYLVYTKYANKPTITFEVFEKSVKTMISKYFDADCNPIVGKRDDSDSEDEKKDEEGSEEEKVELEKTPVDKEVYDLLIQNDSDDEEDICATLLS